MSTENKAKEKSRKDNAQLSKIILSSVGILAYYSRDYKLSVHGRELAKRENGKQKTVSNRLRLLEENKILRSEKKGSIKDYSLNMENPLTASLMVIAEEVKAVRLLSSSFMLKDMVKKIKGLSKGLIIVFGSYARGSHSKGSDLDILILGTHEKKLKDAVKMYPVKTHIMCMGKKSFEKGLSRKENFMLEVLKDHVIIRGSSELVDMFWRHYNG
ncbi:nucleotidyltransferase domain-containing protein [Candidatus Woesearchaeota archaeon]|nr:nucleotidyltransferase domain-containing protein [Candidatus Woesearchaeota archaeon]